MSRDLSQRIRAYAAQIEDDAEHVTVGDLEEMIGGAFEWTAATDSAAPSRQVGRQWPRRAAVSAGALALMIVVVGLPLWFFGGGESAVVVEPSTTVPPTVTTVPPTTVAPVVTTVPARCYPGRTDRVGPDRRRGRVWRRRRNTRHDGYRGR